MLRLHLVNTGVNVDHHIRPCRRDSSLGDANQVVQPTVALMIGLEPADKVLPSRLIALKDRSPAKLEEDRCAILGGDRTAHIRQHATVCAPPWMVRPEPVIPRSSVVLVLARLLAERRRADLQLPARKAIVPSSRTDTGAVSTGHHRAVCTDFGESARF